MEEIPNTLPELTSALISIRKKPTTEARFKSYPAMLQRFNELLESCEDANTLKQVIKMDRGYYLLAGYRQKVIEKLLQLERTPQLLRVYAMQLRLFGDVDELGEANTAIDERVEELEAEADALESDG
jgi:hypothetical protein